MQRLANVVVLLPPSQASHQATDVQGRAKRLSEEVISTEMAPKRVAVSDVGSSSVQESFANVNYAEEIAKRDAEIVKERERAAYEIAKRDAEIAKVREKAAAEREKAAEEIAKRDAEIAKRDEKVKELEMRQSLQDIRSMSMAVIYKNFLEKNPRTIPKASALALYNNLTQDQLAQLQAIVRGHEHPTDLTTEKLIHESMVELLTEILAIVNTGSSHNLKLFNDRPIGNGLRPDVTITAAGVVQPNWADVIGLFEFKAVKPGENTEGRGQAISYLSHTLSAQIGDPGTHLIFSVFLNYERFCVYTYDPINAEFAATEDIPLFDGGLLLFDGVKLLAGLLNDRYSKIRPRIITIGTEKIDALQVYTTHREICCARVMYQGADAVVKYVADSAPMLANKRLCKEARNIESLSELRQLNRLEIVAEFTNALVLKPVGIGLEFAWEDTDPFELLCEFVKQLQVLHKAGYVHGDIRTMNLVVVKDKAMIIDWQTLSRPGPCFVAGGLFCPFTASQHVTDKNCDARFTYACDFEALLYSFCYAWDYWNFKKLYVLDYQKLKKGKFLMDAEEFKTRRNEYVQSLSGSDKKTMRIISRLHSLVIESPDDFCDWMDLVKKAESQE
jgi:hypothetical protein